jgi:hypothetical protein
VACRVAPTELAGVAAPGSSLREGGVRQRKEEHDDLRYSDVSAADQHRDDSVPGQPLRATLKTNSDSCPVRQVARIRLSV